MIVRITLPVGSLEREIPDDLNSWELLTTMRNLGEEAYDKLIDAGYFEGGLRHDAVVPGLEGYSYKREETT